MRIENARITALNVEHDHDALGRSWHNRTTVELMLLQELQAPSGMQAVHDLRCTLIVHEPDPTPGEQLRAAHLQRAKDGAVVRPGEPFSALHPVARAVWEADAAFVPQARKSLGQIAHETLHVRLKCAGIQEYTGLWSALAPERRAAWEAAAAAVVAEFCR